MLTLQEFARNLIITFGASGILAGAAYFFEGRLHDEDFDKEFLKGTFLGAIKLLFIYLIITPIILASPAPAGILNIFRLVLLGLSTILLIELFVYIFTHFVQSEKELFVIGIIGGITRSEAVIAQFIDALKESGSLMEETVLVILIASTTMIFRNLILIAIVMFPLFRLVFFPLLFIGILSIAIFYFTYKKTEVEDIKLKAVSLRTAFEIVFLFTIITAITQSLSAYPILLYLVAAIGALAGALPIVFTVLTLLTFEQITLTVGATMVVLASAIAYSDDAFLALLFKNRELAKQVSIKQVPISIAAILLYFWLSGQLTTLSLPRGIPFYYYLIPVALLALVLGVLFVLKGKIGGGGGGAGESGGMGGGESGGGFEPPEEPEPMEPEKESKKEKKEKKKREKEEKKEKKKMEKEEKPEKQEKEEPLKEEEIAEITDEPEPPKE